MSSASRRLAGGRRLGSASRSVASMSPTSSLARRRSVSRRSRALGRGMTRRTAAMRSARASVSSAAAGSSPASAVGATVAAAVRSIAAISSPAPSSTSPRNVDVASIAVRPGVRRQDEALLRPGHRHVQEPPLLVGVQVARGHRPRAAAPSGSSRPSPRASATRPRARDGTKTIGNSRPFAW